MSKAFDTVRCKIVVEDLKEVPNHDELHMMSIIMKYVKLNVKVGQNTGEEIKMEEELHKETLYILLTPYTDLRTQNSEIYLLNPIVRYTI